MIVLCYGFGSHSQYVFFLQCLAAAEACESMCLACNLPIQCDTKFTDSNEFEGETKTNRIPATESHQVLVMARTAKESAIERIDRRTKKRKISMAYARDRTNMLCMKVSIYMLRERERSIPRNRKK